MKILILGGEKQAGTSLASAYPEHQFTFLTVHPVVDGHDLENVTFAITDKPRCYPQLEGGHDLVICLDSQWYLDDDRLGLIGYLGECMDLLAQSFDWVFPLQKKVNEPGVYRVKGDRYRRPDAITEVSAADADQVDDPYGCGMLFQPVLQARQHLFTVGRKGPEGCLSGTFRNLGEAFGREAFLIAGETCERPDLEERVDQIFDKLEYEGFFTLNWVETDARTWLTSIRPVPRAVFGTLRGCGVDLLGPVRGRVSAPAGAKFVLDLHYAPYRQLA